MSENTLDQFPLSHKRGYHNPKKTFNIEKEDDIGVNTSEE